MNIYLKELKGRYKSFIGWSFGMLFMIAAGMNKYGAFEKSGQNINELFAGLPKGLAAVFGIGQIDILSASGYFSLLFLYLIVMAAIHAALIGSRIIAEEEIDRTAEFLYVKPITRVKIITLKLAAALTYIIALNLVTLSLCVSIVGAYNKGESATSLILLMMAGMFIAQLLFMSVGATAAAVLKKPKLAAPVATSYLFAGFFLYLWLEITDKLPSLKYLTPFKYFDGKVIVKESKLDPVYIAISAATIIVMLAVTYVFYRKKDLSI